MLLEEEKQITCCKSKQCVLFVLCFVCVCVRICEYEEATMVSTSTSVWGLRSWQQAASSYSSLTPGSAYYTMFRPPINSQPATYKF